MGLPANLDAYKEGTVKKSSKEELDIMHRATEDLRNLWVSVKARFETVG